MKYYRLVFLLIFIAICDNVTALQLICEDVEEAHFGRNGAVFSPEYGDFLVHADLTGDGIGDYVFVRRIVTQPARKNVTVLDGHTMQTYILRGYIPLEQTLVTFFDADGDGDRDLVVFVQMTKNLLVYENPMTETSVQLFDEWQLNMHLYQPLSLDFYATVTIIQVAEGHFVTDGGAKQLALSVSVRHNPSFTEFSVHIYHQTFLTVQPLNGPNSCARFGVVPRTQYDDVGDQLGNDVLLCFAEEWYTGPYGPYFTPIRFVDEGSHVNAYVDQRVENRQYIYQFNDIYRGVSLYGLIKLNRLIRKDGLIGYVASAKTEGGTHLYLLATDQSSVHDGIANEKYLGLLRVEDYSSVVALACLDLTNSPGDQLVVLTEYNGLYIIEFNIADPSILPSLQEAIRVAAPGDSFDAVRTELVYEEAKFPLDMRHLRYHDNKNMFTLQITCDLKATDAATTGATITSTAATHDGTSATVVDSSTSSSVVSTTTEMDIDENSGIDERLFGIVVGSSAAVGVMCLLLCGICFCCALRRRGGRRKRSASLEATELEQHMPRQSRARGGSRAHGSAAPPLRRHRSSDNALPGMRRMRSNDGAFPGADRRNRGGSRGDGRRPSRASHDVSAALPNKPYDVVDMSAARRAHYEALYLKPNINEYESPFGRIDGGGASVGQSGEHAYDAVNMPLDSGTGPSREGYDFVPPI